MTHAIDARRIFGSCLGFFEHAAVVVVGFVLMIFGLGLGVTMIMLPVGVVIGLIGAALVVGGLFTHITNK